MPTLVLDNGNLVIVERNKGRIRLGVEGKRKMFSEAGHVVYAGEEAFVDTWLSADEVTWLIDELVRAQKGIRTYNVCKYIKHSRD